MPTEVLAFAVITSLYAFGAPGILSAFLTGTVMVGVDATGFFSWALVANTKPLSVSVNKIGLNICVFLNARIFTGRQEVNIIFRIPIQEILLSAF